MLLRAVSINKVIIVLFLLQMFIHAFIEHARRGKRLCLLTSAMASMYLVKQDLHGVPMHANRTL